MATVQILAFVTLDGYLGLKASFPGLWEHPGRFGLAHIRKRAASCLEPDIPFITLAHWKEEKSGTYLVEARPETLPFVDSLLKFRMADELVLYVLPVFQGAGERLFDGSPGPASRWKLAGARSFDGGVCRLFYRRIAG